jgi:hypothetical protein
LIASRFASRSLLEPFVMENSNTLSVAKERQRPVPDR